MLEVFAFSCSLLLSFVMTGVERNHRQRRPHPPVLIHAGYALVGLLSATAMLLTGFVAGAALGYV
ncbi:hypothetical protein ASE86_11645 [Sphingomonas sp. Leaf33]|uniref:hypothetical protein n=1 Tax=Sphingomonas sp. Leaf33 TaxID=1736215 RepID=UPI0006F62F94|nr:hypothetical protein [Sphingomonas sp. Leaf33]KQN26708.1 hypothetical protein ASE86_11645 [Sphingomonas sp. Leaf33]